VKGRIKWTGGPRVRDPWYKLSASEIVSVSVFRRSSDGEPTLRSPLERASLNQSLEPLEDFPHVRQAWQRKRALPETSLSYIKKTKTMSAD